MRSVRLVRLVPLLAVMAIPAPVAAQIRASELATVSQTVDGTVIKLEYSRPRLRGRDTIFGGEVKLASLKRLDRFLFMRLGKQEKDISEVDFSQIDALAGEINAL